MNGHTQPSASDREQRILDAVGDYFTRQRIHPTDPQRYKRRRFRGKARPSRQKRQPSMTTQDCPLFPVPLDPCVKEMRNEQD